MEKNSKNTKKGRSKKVHNYTFSDQTVNLNGYVAICTITGNEKRFYHSYLAGMIVKRFNNNFSTFEATYVSREGKAGNVTQNRISKVEERITKLYNKISELKAVRDELQVPSVNA
jgi:hypothetical protein